MKLRIVVAGLLLICLGGLAILGPTLAFTSVSADRPTHLSAAETADALLAVEQIDVVVSDQNTPEDVLRVSNNAGEQLALTTDVTIAGSGLREADGFATTLAPGETTTFAVTCVPGSGGGQTAIDVSIPTATGDGIEISGVSETYQIERDCPGPPGPGGPKPPADEVFDIRHESWNDDREYIFEITHNNVQNPDWDFGDGTTATSEYHVSHTFDGPGTYDITLTALLDGEQYTYSDTVVVDETTSCDPKPPADSVYEIRQESWTGDREYIFETTHDDVWSVQWDFGDGTTASDHYVSHTYDQSGTYDITVTAEIGGEDCTYTDTLTVSE